MIIKKYNEAKKEAEVLNQYNVLLVDSSEFSRYATGSLLVRYDFIVKKFFSVKSAEAIGEALNSEDIDLLLINYASCRFDFPMQLRTIKKEFPDILIVIYNFSHSRFEKIQLLKAGVNALFDPDYPFEELLFSLQEIQPAKVLLNTLVDAALLKKVKSAVIESAKDFSKEEVMLVKDICKGLNDLQISDKHKLSKAKAEHALEHLRTITGCESRPDFIRFAMMNKIIKQDESLLARAELTAVA